MCVKWNIAGPAGLRFFGRMTASTTHELNNSLGIINENAGLLEDLVLMAEQGMAVDPDRWVTIANRISGQVRRADRITHRLNSFAHSVDKDQVSVDLCALLEVASSLAARLLAENRVSIELAEEAGPVRLTTAPFLFLHLVGSCLEFIGRNTEKGSSIGLSCSGTGAGGAAVLFSDFLLTGEEPFPGEVEEVLLEALGAMLRIDPELRSMELEMYAKK